MQRSERYSSLVAFDHATADERLRKRGGRASATDRLRAVRNDRGVRGTAFEGRDRVRAIRVVNRRLATTRTLRYSQATDFGEALGPWRPTLWHRRSDAPRRRDSWGWLPPRVSVGRQQATCPRAEAAPRISTPGGWRPLRREDPSLRGGARLTAQPRGLRRRRPTLSAKSHLGVTALAASSQRRQLRRKSCDARDSSQRERRAGSVQFSSFKSRTRSNSAVLFVTSVSPRARACAAMNRSLAPIMTPRRFRSARISA